MQLLIQRGQRKIIIFPIFDLWAKFELNPEEDALITKALLENNLTIWQKAHT